MFSYPHSVVTLSLLFCLLLEIVTVGCAIRWYDDLNLSDGSSGQTLVYTNSNDVHAYTFAVPVFSIIVTLGAIGFSRSRNLSPLPIIGLASLLICLWIIQISIWFTCEVSSHSMPTWCPVQNGNIRVGQAKAYLGIFVALSFCFLIPVVLWWKGKVGDEKLEHESVDPGKSVEA